MLADCCFCPLVFVAVARVKVTRLGHCLFVGDKKWPSRRTCTRQMHFAIELASVRFLLAQLLMTLTLIHTPSPSLLPWSRHSRETASQWWACGLHSQATCLSLLLALKAVIGSLLQFFISLLCLIKPVVVCQVHVVLHFPFLSSLRYDALSAACRFTADLHLSAAWVCPITAL